MDRKPLKRHPALKPLSRQHHKGLILAQLLKSDVLDYKGLPTDVPGKVAFAKKELEARLSRHFNWEATVLIPATRAYHEELHAMSDQVQAEHRQITAQIQQLSDTSTPGDLDELGRLLEQHIRFEERAWFAAIQREVPETVLSQLPPLEG